MNTVYISSTDRIIRHVVEILTLHLRSGERVTWLLSGGSAIELEVNIAQELQTLDVSRLTVGLMDERYGPPGHKDENYVQLMEAYFPIYITRVLSGDSAAKTTKTFGTFIERALHDTDFSIGLFGIGPDGHTAGIKPHSPAITSTQPAVYYEWDDYKRITITPPIIKQLDEAVLYAVGNQKAETLKALVHTNTPITDQPAQVLKTVKTATLYTDNRL